MMASAALGDTVALLIARINIAAMCGGNRLSVMDVPVLVAFLGTRCFPFFM